MKYVLYFPVLILGLYILGCSELESNIEQPESINYHKEGINDPSKPDFHGKFIRDINWDMNQCQQCHGKNYDGGTVKASCLTCHTLPAGPENCSTCHGSGTSPAPPVDLSGNTSINERGVGAHQVHLTAGKLGKKVSCAECHVVPANYFSQGHIDSDHPAEVPMNGYLATLKTNDPSTTDYTGSLPLFVPDPAYDSPSSSCSNTYCHGYFKNGNTDNTVIWTDPSSVECGTCHGDPSRPTKFEKALPRTVEEGGSHLAIQPDGGVKCSDCHRDVIDENMNIIDPSRHIDGKLNLFGSDIAF